MNGKSAIALMAALVSGCGTKEEVADEKKLVTTISHHSRDCADKQYPVALTVQNNSNKKLLARSVMVSLTQKGHSTILHATQLENDAILQPGFEQVTCHPILMGAMIGYYSEKTPADHIRRMEVLKTLAPDEIEYEAYVDGWRFEPVESAT